MARSSAQRKKRFSTSQVLDLLNNVNKPAQPSIPRPAWRSVSRGRRRRRSTRERDDIYAFPVSPDRDSEDDSLDKEANSPSRSPRTQNQLDNTTTPRRSARFANKLHSTDTPRPSAPSDRRLNTADTPRRSARLQSAQSDRQSPTADTRRRSARFQVQDSSGTSLDDGDIGTDEERGSSKIELFSPSGSSTSSSDSLEDDGLRSSSELLNGTVRDEIPESESEEDAQVEFARDLEPVEGSAGEEREDALEANSPEHSVLDEEEDEDEEESEASSDARADESEPAEPLDTKETTENYRDEESADEHSSPSPAKRRRVERPHEQQVHVEIPLRQRGSPIPPIFNISTGDRRHAPRVKRVALHRRQRQSDSASLERSGPDSIREPVNENGSEGDEPWFEEAINLGQQRESWLTLVRKAESIKEVEPPSLANFGAIDTSILMLRQVYDDIAERGPSTVLLQESQTLVKEISEEFEDFYNDQVWVGPNPSASKLHRARCVLGEFEGHVIPQMVALAKACLGAHFMDGILIPRGDHQLLLVMNLLLSFCNRFYFITTEKYINGKSLSRHLRLPARQIIEALESGAYQTKVTATVARSQAERRGLQGSQSSFFNYDVDDDVDVAVSHPKREWTDDEGYALIDGLKRYEGPDRYIRIMRLFRDRLRGRTLEDLQDRSQLIRRWILQSPETEARLQTRQGRQEWRWLLSV